LAGSGDIDLEELRAAIRMINPEVDEDELQRMIALGDVDGDKEVSNHDRPSREISHVHLPSRLVSYPHAIPPQHPISYRLLPSRCR
jgi:hypothetical protein